MRALAAKAYQRGAKFVDVQYFDMHIKRARILDADAETLDYVPPWYGQRLLELGRLRCARIGLSGPATPGLLDDLDPHRAGRDQLPFVREAGKVVNDRTTNWTIVPYPTVGWARQVHPALPDEEALARLCEQILHVCRLDEADPVAAWKERADLLVAIATRVTERHFDALRFEGPGTDLTVGLLPERPSSWRRASRPSTASSTCPTCPPRRSSARPIRSAPTAWCGRPSRCHRRLDHQGARGRVPRRPRGAHRCRRGRRRPARLRRARRGRVAAGRGRARRRRRAHRQARHGVLRHAARRERGVATSRWARATVHRGRGGPRRA